MRILLLSSVFVFVLFGERRFEKRRKLLKSLSIEFCIFSAEMPTPSFVNELSEEDAKKALIGKDSIFGFMRGLHCCLLEICRSPASAQNLERIIRCLLPFWDSARCALVVDKGKKMILGVICDLRFNLGVSQ